MPNIGRDLFVTDVDIKMKKFTYSLHVTKFAGLYTYTSILPDGSAIRSERPLQSLEEINKEFSKHIEKFENIQLMCCRHD